MLKGIHLTLLIGPVVPLPAPRIVLDALQSVKVTSSAGASGASGFQLTFTFSADSPLHTIFLLAGGQTPLLARGDHRHDQLGAAGADGRRDDESPDPGRGRRRASRR